MAGAAHFLMTTQHLICSACSSIGLAPFTLVNMSSFVAPFRLSAAHQQAHDDVDQVRTEGGNNDESDDFCAAQKKLFDDGISEELEEIKHKFDTNQLQTERKDCEGPRRPH